MYGGQRVLCGAGLSGRQHRESLSDYEPCLFLAALKDVLLRCMPKRLTRRTCKALQAQL